MPTWYIVDSLNFNRGVRYTKENKDYTFQRRNPDVTPSAALGETLLSCPADSPPVPGFPRALLTNAGDATIKGAELELEAHTVEHLTVDGTVSYQFQVHELSRWRDSARFA